MVKLNIKNELYERYADDIDLAQRSIGRKLKFCPLDGCMVEKTADEIESELHMEEDELTMIELKKVADSLMENIETEYDCPSHHHHLFTQNLETRYLFWTWLCGWKILKSLPEGWKVRGSTPGVERAAPACH